MFLYVLVTCRLDSSCRSGDRLENYNQEQGTASQDVKERLTKCCLKDRKRTIFRGLEFLLTGFSKKKENEIEGLLRKHGGTVLSNIPPPPPHPRRKSSRSNLERLPVVLSTKKVNFRIFWCIFYFYLHFKYPILFLFYHYTCIFYLVCTELAVEGQGSMMAITRVFCSSVAQK